MKEALFIIFGWALGVTTPWFAERLQRPSRRARIKKGLFVEFSDLRTKLAALVIRVKTHSGSLDADTLDWFKKILDADPEAFAQLGLEPGLEDFFKLPDETIRSISRAKAPGPNVQLNFKRYSLPYLNAHVSELSLFQEEFQRLAHRIRGHLAMLNQEIDVSWFYFQKTFDQLSDLNRDIIARNTDSIHASISFLSREIADDISRILRL